MCTRRGLRQAERAERLVEAELRRLGWTAETLAQRLRVDLAKVRFAQRSWDRTPVTLAWIVRWLQMSSVAYVNNRLCLLRQGKLK